MFEGFLDDFKINLVQFDSEKKSDIKVERPDYTSTRLPLRIYKCKKKRKKCKSLKLEVKPQVTLKSSHPKNISVVSNCTKLFPSKDKISNPLSKLKAHSLKKKPKFISKNTKHWNKILVDKSEESFTEDEESEKVKTEDIKVKESSRCDGKICLGSFVEIKSETLVKKENVYMPQEFTPYKKFEAKDSCTGSEVGDLFENIHKNLFPKFRYPMEAKQLLETKTQIPKCYEKIVNSFNNIELALFWLTSRNETLSYLKMKELVFNQTNL